MRDKKLFVVGYHNTDTHEFEAGTFAMILCECPELMTLDEVIASGSIGEFEENWEMYREEDEPHWNELSDMEQIRFIEKSKEKECDEVMFLLFCNTEEEAQQTLKEIEQDYEDYIDNTEVVKIKQSQKTGKWEDVRTIKSKA